MGSNDHSFDVVSEVNHHELSNAVDQANREIDNRFDFKGSGAKYLLEKEKINLQAPNEFQVQQMQDILKSKLAKRSLDVKCLEWGSIATNLSEARQEVKVRQGIDKELAKKITKIIKDTAIKVQAAIQGDQVRVTGKNRDDLQQIIQVLRESDTELPLQFTNFRD